LEKLLEPGSANYEIFDEATSEISNDTAARPSSSNWLNIENIWSNLENFETSSNNNAITTHNGSFSDYGTRGVIVDIQNLEFGKDSVANSSATRLSTRNAETEERENHLKSHENSLTVDESNSITGDISNVNDLIILQKYDIIHDDVEHLSNSASSQTCNDSAQMEINHKEAVDNNSEDSYMVQLLEASSPVSYENSEFTNISLSSAEQNYSESADYTVETEEYWQAYEAQYYEDNFNNPNNRSTIASNKNDIVHGSFEDYLNDWLNTSQMQSLTELTDQLSQKRIKDNDFFDTIFFNTKNVDNYFITLFNFTDLSIDQN